jgi:hypothetical protein
VQKVKEAILLCHFDLKHRWNLFPIPNSLLLRFHLKRRRNRFPIPYSLFPAFAVSLEALAVPQLDAEDSVLVAKADQRKVFSERPFKLDDLVL